MRYIILVDLSTSKSDRQIRPLTSDKSALTVALFCEPVGT